MDASEEYVVQEVLHSERSTTVSRVRYGAHNSLCFSIILFFCIDTTTKHWSSNLVSSCQHTHEGSSNISKSLLLVRLLRASLLSAMLISKSMSLIMFLFFFHVFKVIIVPLSPLLTRTSRFSSSNVFPFPFSYIPRFDHGYALIMEDIGGTPLTNLLNNHKQGLPLDIFFEVACKISMW